MSKPDQLASRSPSEKFQFGWQARLALALCLALGASLATGCHRHGVGTDNNNNGDPGPCGPGYVIIPEGPFEMGVDQDDPRFFLGAPAGSYPKVVVQMSDYCIGRTEVSVGAYRACVAAGVCEEPAQVTDVLLSCNYSRAPGDREDHPVTCVTWEQARTYCQDWEGGDLPSEAQWEKAARGASMDGRILPWGDEPVSCERANYDENGEYFPEDGTGRGYGCSHDEYRFTWPVGHLTSTKGDSPFSVKDMAGNVAEFGIDCFDTTFYARCLEQGCVDPVDVDFEGCWRSTRGGTAKSDDRSIDSIHRGRLEPTTHENYIGFRCTSGLIGR